MLYLIKKSHFIALVITLLIFVIFTITLSLQLIDARKTVIIQEEYITKMENALIEQEYRTQSLEYQEYVQ